MSIEIEELYVKRFIDTALTGIPIESLPVDFYHFEYEQMQRMVFSICTEILTERLKTAEDIGTEVVHTFITKLRDKIDEISCDPDDGQRKYSPAEIATLIDKFLTGVRLERRSSGGRRVVEITLPEDIAEHALEARFTIRPERPKRGAKDGKPIDE